MSSLPTCLLPASSESSQSGQRNPNLSQIPRATLLPAASPLPGAWFNVLNTIKAKWVSHQTPATFPLSAPPQGHQALFPSSLPPAPSSGTMDLNFRTQFPERNCDCLSGDPLNTRGRWCQAGSPRDQKGLLLYLRGGGQFQFAEIPKRHPQGIRGESPLHCQSCTCPGVLRLPQEHPARRC